MGVFRIPQYVGEVDNATLQRHPTGEGATARRKRIGEKEFFCFVREPARRKQAIDVLAPAKHERVIGATKSRHGLHQDIENLFKVQR